MVTYQMLTDICDVFCVTENVPWPQQLSLSQQDLDLEAASPDLSKKEACTTLTPVSKGSSHMEVEHKCGALPLVTVPMLR